MLFLYLTSVSSVFLLYLLLCLTKPPRSHQNKRSHTNFFLRQGAVIFGLGSVLFFGLDTAGHIVHYECVGLLKLVTGRDLTSLFASSNSLTIINIKRFSFKHRFTPNSYKQAS